MHVFIMLIFFKSIENDSDETALIKAMAHIKQPKLVVSIFYQSVHLELLGHK